jgi:hypothetical protein
MSSLCREKNREPYMKEQKPDEKEAGKEKKLQFLQKWRDLET